MNLTSAEIVANLALVDPGEILDALAQVLRNTSSIDHSPKTCPHCGYNLVSDRLIIRDGFTADPRGKVFYGEKRLNLTPVESQILLSVMKDKGRTVEYEALAARTINVRKSTPKLVLRQHIHNMRKKMHRAGVPFPLKAENSIGYYWSLNH